MTHREIRQLPDGTRRYAGGERYTPVAPQDRVYGVNKPDDDRAVRFHTRWFLPLELVPESERVMPETRPDSVAYGHMARPLACKCSVCTRPEAEVWKRRWVRDNLRLSEGHPDPDSPRR